MIKSLPFGIRKKITDMKSPFGTDKYWEEFRFKLEKKEFEFAPELLKKWHE